uniref:Uncharacterized protein n=1 Tax=Arundo donax TaxID=35708 RepID=A0A0A9BWI3_ARUDO
MLSYSGEIWKKNLALLISQFGCRIKKLLTLLKTPAYYNALLNVTLFISKCFINSSYII